MHLCKKDVVAGFKGCLQDFYDFSHEKGRKIDELFFLKFIINMQKEILMNKLEVIIKGIRGGDDKLAEDIVVIDMQLASPIFDTFCDLFSK